jgi:futalosine hydrolase
MPAAAFANLFPNHPGAAHDPRPCGVLLLAAAPKECEAICRAFPGSTPPTHTHRPVLLGAGVELVRTGVGKVNAALAVASAIDPARHGLVLNLGICGCLPSPDGRFALSLTKTLVGSASVYADEGISLPGDGWMSIARAGFPPIDAGPRDESAMGFAAQPALVANIMTALRAGHSGDDASPVCAPIACVSSCSGTARDATLVAARTGALGEAMEGAAIAHALRLLAPDVLFAEVRVVSNTTGDRDAQVWNLSGAFEALTETTRRLCGVGAMGR